MRSSRGVAAVVFAIVVGSSTIAVPAAVRDHPGASGVNAAPQAPLWQQRVQRWLRVAERHGAGTADDAARQVASWPYDDLTTLLADVASLRDLLARAYARQAGSTDRQGITYADSQFTIAEVEQVLGLSEDEARRGDINRVLRRGVLLHTDIAVLVPPAEGPLVGRPVVVLLRDGRQDSLTYSMTGHWRFARALSDALRPDPSQDETVQPWYRATGAYLQSRGYLEDAAAQLERARELFPGDAEIQFYSGCVQEAFAAPSLQNALQSVTLPARRRIAIASQDSCLKAAAGFFRRAIQLNAGLAEARVRLAHVTSLLGNHDEASEQLAQSLTPADPLVLYYASLLLGDEEQARGWRESARASYQRAAALFPAAQSPLLALSCLALRFGDREGALRATEGIARLPAERFDPWAEYDRTGGRHGASLLADWRQALAEGARR
jgi:hypothetical protein